MFLSILLGVATLALIVVVVKKSREKEEVFTSSAESHGEENVYFDPIDGTVLSSPYYDIEINHEKLGVLTVGVNYANRKAKPTDVLKGLKIHRFKRVKSSGWCDVDDDFDIEELLWAIDEAMYYYEELFTEEPEVVDDTVSEEFPEIYESDVQEELPEPELDEFPDNENYDSGEEPVIANEYFAQEEVVQAEMPEISSEEAYSTDDSNGTAY